MKTTNKLEEYIIFTDLDGTLLDHTTYSFKEAQEMLLVIKQLRVPLIIVTSKTKAEVIEIQKKLAIEYPFIIENGAGIFIPKTDEYTQISLGQPYATTLQFFQKYKKTIPMRGFSEMSVQEIALATKLPLEKAAQAKKRDFSEPFLLQKDSDFVQLKHFANADGFDVVKGGRFYHLISKGQDKANAVQEVHKYYEKLHTKKYKTLALGDGENDITMLATVNQPFLIRKIDNTYIPCSLANIIKSDEIGPKGWNRSLKRFFDVN